MSAAMQMNAFLESKMELLQKALFNLPRAAANAGAGSDSLSSGGSSASASGNSPGAAKGESSSSNVRGN